MEFEILGPLRNPETIAVGPSVRDRARLRRLYGHGRWRKRKGIATVRLPDINQRPLAFGTDLVNHSATKYLGGHNDTAVRLAAVGIEDADDLIADLRQALDQV